MKKTKIKALARNIWTTEDGNEIIVRYSGKKDSERCHGKFHFSGKNGGMTAYEEVYNISLGQEILARDVPEDEIKEKLKELGYIIQSF